MYHIYHVSSPSPPNTYDSIMPFFFVLISVIFVLNLFNDTYDLAYPFCTHSFIHSLETHPSLLLYHSISLDTCYHALLFPFRCSLYPGYPWVCFLGHILQDFAILHFSSLLNGPSCMMHDVRSNGICKWTQGAIGVSSDTCSYAELKPAGRDGHWLDVPVTLRILVDSAIRAEFAHLKIEWNRISKFINALLSAKRTFAVVLIDFLIHSSLSRYASSTISSAAISAWNNVRQRTVRRYGRATDRSRSHR